MRTKIIIVKSIGKEKIVSLSTISTIIRVLNSELQKDSSLVNDLLKFLKDKNIDIPISHENRVKYQAPVNYDIEKSDNKIDNLKRAFEGVNTIENIL